MQQKGSLVLIVGILLASGCATLSKNQKKYLAFGTCTLVGGALGAEAGKNGNSPRSTTALNGLGAGTACFMAADTFIKDKKDEIIKDLRTENENIKRGLTDGKLQDAERDDVLKIEPPSQTNCKGELRLLAICPDKNGEVKACKGPIGWQYVNKSWVVKWVAYRSLNNCFIPPYRAPQQLDNLTKELERTYVE